jgi:hypothetical protein
MSGSGSLTLTSIGTYANGFALKLSNTTTRSASAVWGNDGYGRRRRSGNFYLGSSFGRLGTPGSHPIDPSSNNSSRPSTFETIRP